MVLCSSSMVAVVLNRLNGFRKYRRNLLIRHRNVELHIQLAHRTVTISQSNPKMWSGCERAMRKPFCYAYAWLSWHYRNPIWGAIIIVTQLGRWQTHFTMHIPYTSTIWVIVCDGNAFWGRKYRFWQWKWKVRVYVFAHKNDIERWRRTRLVQSSLTSLRMSASFETARFNGMQNSTYIIW